MDASEDFGEVSRLTQWEETAPLKFYMQVKSNDSSAKWDEINKCSICQMELFEEI